MMPSRHQTRTRAHASRTLFTSTLLLIAAVALEAQTVNPRIVEFDPSPDHGTTLSSGQAAVTRYDLEVYQQGASAPFHTVNMGKPAPQSDGKIRFDFSSQVSAWPLPGGTYVSKVAAVGPNGSGRSNASDTFTFQSTAPCTYSISPSSTNIASGGGSGSFGVTAGSGCAWTASKSASWVTLNTTSGSGNGTVSFTVGANTSTSPRSATIAAAGQTFTINQAGVSCSYSISPANVSVGSGGGTATFGLSTGSGCSWNASSNASWLSVQPGSGSGNATLTVTVAANGSTSARTGTVTAGGKTFTVSQAGETPCTFAVSPSSADVAAAGGSTSFTVTTTGSCGWTATTTANWISLSKTSGSGTASITVSVAASADTSPRSGTVSVGGQTFTVTQAGASQPPPPAPTPCSYGVSPTFVSLSASGGSASIAVTTGTECAWTASNSAGWISLANGGGSGNGSVTVSAGPNASTSPRSATLMVAGQSVTVSQSGLDCSVSVSPGSQRVGANGGSGTLNVAAPSGCSWTASTGAAWLKLQSTSGSGNGSIGFAAERNSGNSARAASVSVADQTATISQDGQTCSYALEPASASLPAAGGSGQFALTTEARCAWTVVSSADWLSANVTEGSGSATILFTAARPKGNASRTATLTVGSQVFSVTIASAKGPGAPKNLKITVVK